MGREHEKARGDRAPGARERQGRGEAAKPGGFGVTLEAEHQRLLEWANAIDLERRIATEAARVREEEGKAARALATTLATAEALPTVGVKKVKRPQAPGFYPARVRGREVELWLNREGEWRWCFSDSRPDSLGSAWSVTTYGTRKTATWAAGSEVRREQKKAWRKKAKRAALKQAV